MFQFSRLKEKGKKPHKIFLLLFIILFPVVCLFSFPPAVGRGCIHLDFGQQQPKLPMPPPPPRLRCTWYCARLLYPRGNAFSSLLLSLFPIRIYTHIYIYKYISRIYIYIRRRRREQKRAMEPSPWQSQRYRPLSISFSRYFFPLFLLLIFLSPIQSCTPPHRARKKPRHTTTTV
jgi:hypothetical protein